MVRKPNCPHCNDWRQVAEYGRSGNASIYICGSCGAKWSGVRGNRYTCEWVPGMDSLGCFPDPGMEGIAR